MDLAAYTRALASTWFRLILIKAVIFRPHWLLKGDFLVCSLFPTFEYA